MVDEQGRLDYSRAARTGQDIEQGRWICLWTNAIFTTYICDRKLQQGFSATLVAMGSLSTYGQLGIPSIPWLRPQRSTSAI